MIRFNRVTYEIHRACARQEQAQQELRPPKNKEQAWQELRPPKNKEQAQQELRPPKNKEQARRYARPPKNKEQAREYARPPKRFLVSVVLAFALLAFAGCGTSAKEKGDGQTSHTLKIVTTTGMIADLALNVGGEHVQVEALMGPGVDPHLYKASEGDVRRMSSADIILFNGLHLEGAMAEVFERMSSRIFAVAVTNGIDRAKLTSPPEFKGNHDPHVWFDVTLWMDALETVRVTLVTHDSTHAATYNANAERYRDSLVELHQYVIAAAQSVPSEMRVLVTAHDAFNYFGRAYGFEVRGLQGISTVTEAGTADVQSLAEFIASRKIPAIFVESSVPARSIEAVQAAVRARGHDVLIGGQLFSDAMGSPGTPEGTYPGMVRYNINTIVHALSRTLAAEAPEG